MVVVHWILLGFFHTLPFSRKATFFTWLYLPGFSKDSRCHYSRCSNIQNIIKLKPWKYCNKGVIEPLNESVCKAEDVDFSFHRKG